ncbi:phosphoglycerate mutase family protein [Ulvibacterium marinum]|uniref:phosphoglycerate mutase family protein n=1 Tax=Ulvibacterium marinum TaxID=2419782 RepID=UPI002493EC07|nr:phosphoglycerate mutase family protein [Ulvibacterium marinum]
MKSIKLVLALVVLFLFQACDEDKKPEESYSDGVSTFYFIRHAEKDRSNPDNVDPELNQKGLGRSMHWAEIFDDVPLDAIYTTDYERATMTAAPTSVKQDILVQYYVPEEIDIEQFKVDNLNKKVLVVGHSNTTPQFVNLMIGEDKYGLMDDYDNGSLYIVQMVNGTVTDMRLQFNCNCPEGR